MKSGNSSVSIRARSQRKIDLRPMKHSVIRRGIPIIPLLIIGVFSLHAADMDRKIGAVYLEESIHAFENGSYESAETLALTAAEFFPGSSDTMYVLSMIAEATDSSIRRSILLALAAFDSGSWSRMDEREARVRTARLLYRTRRYSEAANILDGLADPLFTAESAALTISVMIANGRFEQAKRFTAEASDRYPADRRVYLSRLRAFPETADDMAARVLEGEIFADDAGIVGTLVENVSPWNDRIEPMLSMAYLELGASDPGVRLIALERTGGLGTQEIVDYLSLGEVSSTAIDRLREAVEGTGLEPVLLEMLEKYDGWITEDRDSDGLGEWRILYSSGEPLRIVADEDQDGSAEAEMLFDSGKPSTLVYTIDGETFKVLYSSYPRVGSIEVSVNSDVTRYEIPPGRMILPGIVELSGRTPVWYAPALPRLPGREDLSGYSHTVTVSRAADEGNMSVRRRTERDREIVTDFVDGAVVRVTELEAGVPVTVKRDVDGDGVFDVVERYAGTVVAEISFDADGDGTHEYIYFPIDSREEWDFDDDGRIDCRQYPSENGTVREYSSAMNGTLDVKLVIGETIERNGAVIPVYPGEDGTMWVGSPPDPSFEFTVSGLSENEGRSYMIYSVNGKRYIEVLP